MISHCMYNLSNGFEFQHASWSPWLHSHLDFMSFDCTCRLVTSVVSWHLSPSDMCLRVTFASTRDICLLVAFVVSSHLSFRDICRLGFLRSVPMSYQVQSLTSLIALSNLGLYLRLGRRHTSPQYPK